MENELHPSDCVGRLAARVLAAADRHRLMPNTPTAAPYNNQMAQVQKMQHLLVEDERRALREADKDIESLRRLVEHRGSVEVPRRAAQYFTDLFPHMPTDVNGKGVKGANRLWLGAKTIAALARDLVALKRLFDPPDRWRERTLFDKEQAYAGDLLVAPPFVRARDELLAEYGPDCLRECVYADFRVLDWLEREYAEAEELLLPGDRRPDITDGPSEPLRFSYDVARLCMKFCLAGLSRDTVVPRQFRIHTADNTLRIEVPNFMDIDLAREIPSDVVNVLQKRGDAPYEITPGFAAAYQQRQHHIDVWLAFVVFAAAAARDGKTVNWINEQVLSIRDIASRVTQKAERGLPPDRWSGHDTAIRQLQRRLNVIVVSYDERALRDALEDGPAVERLRTNLAAAGHAGVTGKRRIEAPIIMLAGVDPQCWDGRKGAAWAMLRRLRQLIAGSRPAGL